LVADRLADCQYQVVSTSSVVNRGLRLLDILMTLVRHRRTIDIQCLEIYSGLSFVMQDLASGLGKLLGQRIVMVLHGGALPQFIARHPRWARRVLRRGDALVAPSPYLQRAVAELGLSARVIPNFVDVSNTSFRHRMHLAPRLFWMRSFDPLWNPEMAIRVLARLRRTVPGATLVMAGKDKGSLHHVQRLARDLGVDNAVRFPGFLDSSAKLREGEAADIFLTTNRIDNMPVAVVEACAMGLPVVATNVGGISDFLTDNETALLVPDNDDEAMAAAVVRLLGDPHLARQLSANGRALAQRSAWETVAGQWERLFQEVLASTPATPCGSQPIDHDSCRTVCRTSSHSDPLFDDSTA
jgi:glycosyltransferase involved in cell wall biosynthesis